MAWWGLLSVSELSSGSSASKSILTSSKGTVEMMALAGMLPATR